MSTDNQKMKAAETERLLKEAQAKAAQQSALTESNLHIEINKNQAEAKKIRLTADANRDKIGAEAEANAKRIKLEAEAEALKINEVGGAEAEKIRKVGDAQAEAIKTNPNLHLVPENTVNLGGEQSDSNALSTLLQLLSIEKLKDLKPKEENKQREL